MSSPKMTRCAPPPGLKPLGDGDQLFLLLREGKIKEFNARRAAGEMTDLTRRDLRSADLRGLVADGLDLSGSYFRQADLRGIDFTHACLEGASLNGARISGTLLPRELTAGEIMASVSLGIRMRYRT